MSIKAYTGIMGSGKSYEVVSVVILNALRSGRRVISNIAGLNYASIADLLVSEGVPADSVGKLVIVDHDRVTDSEFWLSESELARLKETPEYLASFDDVNRIMPGDLVALDEIWRFWSGFNAKDADGKKRPENVLNFMRMHRHMTHPKTGVACDLALITQDVMDISRQVRAVIEETYFMEKLTAIGSAKRYRVDICPRGQSRKVLRSIQREYDPKYFSLYSSHSGRKDGDAEAYEQNIDKRGNLLAGALFKFVIPVGVVVFLFAIYSVYGFFNPKKAEPPQTTVKPSNPTTGETPQNHRTPDNTSTENRVAGWIALDGALIALVSDGNRVRKLRPPNFKLDGNDLETFLPGGEPVTPWSGTSTKSGLLPVPNQ